MSKETGSAHQFRLPQCIDNKLHYPCPCHVNCIAHVHARCRYGQKKQAIDLLKKYIDRPSNLMTVDWSCALCLTCYCQHTGKACPGFASHASQTCLIRMHIDACGMDMGNAVSPETLRTVAPSTTIAHEACLRKQDLSISFDYHNVSTTNCITHVQWHDMPQKSRAVLQRD